MKEYTIHISKQNSKLGKVPSFSTTPVVGCGANCKVCKDKCYALKSYRMYPSCKKAWDDNFEAVKMGHKWRLADIIGEYCNSKKIPVFRWFVSGDIYNMPMMEAMVNIALRCENTIFYCYTKCYDVVNDYLKYDFLPDNLKIIFSRWDGLEMVNPYGLPESDVILKGSDKQQVNNSFICPNQKDKKITCDKCPCPCYLMENGETVYFMEH